MKIHTKLVGRKNLLWFEWSPKWHLDCMGFWHTFWHSFWHILWHFSGFYNLMVEVWEVPLWSRICSWGPLQGEEGEEVAENLTTLTWQVKNTTVWKISIHNFGFMCRTPRSLWFHFAWGQPAWERKGGCTPSLRPTLSIIASSFWVSWLIHTCPVWWFYDCWVNIGHYLQLAWVCACVFSRQSKLGTQWLSVRRICHC